MNERTITMTTVPQHLCDSARAPFDGRSEVLTEAECIAYQELLAEIEHLERLEDVEVAKNVRLETASEEPWALY